MKRQIEMGAQGLGCDDDDGDDDDDEVTYKL